MPKDDIKSKHWHRANDTWGWVYFLGVVGTAVYYIQQTSGFWPIVLAILKGFVWPALLLHKVFTLLQM